MTRPFLRWGAAALTAFGVFSIAFSLLAERSLWPQLPPGALHDTDLVAGFVAAVGLVVLLAARRGEIPRGDRGVAGSADSPVREEPPDRGVGAGGDSLG
ncbi:MAG TPA: hypothetical protein VOA00_06880 [Thermoanaerobaculia bacterium]|nr:hypothetical protein [Thermoanaerobaculia bacterium]